MAAPSGVEMAMEHKVDGLTVAALPSGIFASDDFGGGYTILTDTFDTVRFPSSDLPISLLFEDGLGHVHEVEVRSASEGTIELLVPVPLHIFKHVGSVHRGLIWQGTDLQERTLLDTWSTFALCSFSYASGRPVALEHGSLHLNIPHSHGIRIHVKAFGRSGEGSSLSQWTAVKWQEFLDVAGIAMPDGALWPASARLPAGHGLAASSEEELGSSICSRPRTDGVRNLQVHLALMLTQWCWGSAAVVNKLGLSGTGMSPMLFALIREASAAPLLLLLLACIRGEPCPWFGFAAESALVDAPATEEEGRRDGGLLRMEAVERAAHRASWSEGGRSANSPRSRRRARCRKVLWRFLPGVFIFVDQFCSLTGNKLAGPTSAAAWQPSQIVFTICVSVCIGQEALTGRKVCGMVLVFAGAVCLVWLGGRSHGVSGGGSNPRAGQLFFLFNCLASSLEVVVWRSLLRHSRSPTAHLAVMAESYLAAAVLMCTACVIVSSFPAAVNFLCPECDGNPWRLPPDAVWAIVYSVVFQTIVGYCAQAWALRYADSSLVALYSATQPIFATLLSCALLVLGIDPRGSLSWPGIEMSGSVLIVLGLLVTISGSLSSKCCRSVAT